MNKRKKYVLRVEVECPWCYKWTYAEVKPGYYWVFWCPYCGFEDDFNYEDFIPGETDLNTRYFD